MTTLLAFAAVYLIWGSTYLAIRWGVESIPPFLMTAVRCAIAGAVLFGWSIARSDPRPGGRAWLAALGVGLLLFVAGQGALAWAETRVPSGHAALLLATVPLWMVLLASLRGGRAPGPRVWAGLGAGVGGVLLLMDRSANGGGLDTAGAIVILFAALAWAVGSMWARGAALPSSRAQSAGMQLLMAAAVMFALSLLLGEWRGFSLAAVELRSALALGYLIVFGSIVAFTAYLWLLDHSTPAGVGSHAYVNPVVAVFLAAIAGDGVLTGRSVLAAGAAVTAILLTLEERESGARGGLHGDHERRTVGRTGVPAIGSGGLSTGRGSR